MHRLTRTDVAGLASFASFRLTRVRLDPSAGEDLAQDALLAVLRGLESLSAGRHPRPIDLEDDSKFLDYLKGVIGSLVEAERRRWAHPFDHEPFDEHSHGDDPFPGRLGEGPQSELEFQDLRHAFFERLAQRTPDRLREMVLAWEKQGEDSDTIPLLGRHRRARKELRKLAVLVLKELSRPAAAIPHRKEMNEPCR
jgi:hypothetical protein